MLFLFRLFSSEPWNWGPEFTPEIPLSPILIWGGRIILAYIAFAVLSNNPLFTLSLLAFAFACWQAWKLYVKG